MKLCETRKIDELGRLVIPSAVRSLLGVAIGDSLDMYYSHNDSTILLKRSEVNETICGLCKMKEMHIQFKNLNLCRECADGIAMLDFEHGGIS